jgi:hypothetical protein
MKKYYVSHRVGSYYIPFAGFDIIAKNGIQALRKAREYAQIKFKESENLDLRVTVINENYNYEGLKFEARYCLGICKFKEHYYELEEKN